MQVQHRRRRRPDARRDEILRAAGGLLAAEGPAGVSMDAVAVAAGAAKGTIYRYFSSRAELVAAIREEYSASLAALARAELLEAPGPADERWARFAEAMLDFSLANHALHHALFRAEAVTEDRSMEPLREVVRTFLEQQIAAGTLDLPRAEPMLRVLLDGFHGALVAVAHETGGGSREDFLDVARLMGRSLLGARP
jgi:AcrR family transcriptional regulator